MKYTLLLLIQLYWRLVPEENRPRCLYKTDCSHKIYNVTKEEGFISGLKASLYRYKTCKRGYSVFQNPVTGKVQMILANNRMIPEELIADRYLNRL